MSKQENFQLTKIFYMENENLNKPNFAEKFLNSESKMERAMDRHPLKKVGSPEELANTAVYLLLNSSWITGQIIGVDGGIGTLKV